LFTQWKKILAELRDLKFKEYPEAGVDRRIEISKRYDELIAQEKGCKTVLLPLPWQPSRKLPSKTLQSCSSLWAS